MSSCSPYSRPLNLCSFEPEYGSDEKSSTSSDEDESSSSDEERIGLLGSLEWCKCENCDTTTLNHPRECLRCREIPEVLALADFIHALGAMLKINNALTS